MALNRAVMTLKRHQPAIGGVPICNRAVMTLKRHQPAIGRVA
jgi:hypothetical protein